jgi:hypothetical protein
MYSIRHGAQSGFDIAGDGSTEGEGRDAEAI